MERRRYLIRAAAPYALPVHEKCFDSVRVMSYKATALPTAESHESRRRGYVPVRRVVEGPPRLA